MTRPEFSNFISRIHDLWGAEFDTGQTTVWYQVMGSLNLNRLLLALNELSLVLKFPPKIAEIVDTYEEIKIREANAARKQHVTQQKHLSSELHYCHICRNDGIVMYDKEGYEYMARCSCGRGKDLNRWSRHQITAGMTMKNPKTLEEESIYVVCIDDVLSPEEIGLLQAKNMSRSHDIQSRADIMAVVKGLQFGGVA